MVKFGASVQAIKHHLPLHHLDLMVLTSFCINCLKPRRWRGSRSKMYADNKKLFWEEKREKTRNNNQKVRKDWMQDKT